MTLLDYYLSLRESLDFKLHSNLLFKRTLRVNDYDLFPKDIVQSYQIIWAAKFCCLWYVCARQPPIIFLATTISRTSDLHGDSISASWRVLSEHVTRGLLKVMQWRNLRHAPLRIFAPLCHKMYNGYNGKPRSLSIRFMRKIGDRMCHVLGPWT